MDHYIENPASAASLAPSKKLMAILSLILISLPSNAAGIDETINSAMQPITAAVAGFIFFEVSVFGTQLPLIIVWLIGASVFFTFYFKFLNLRGFKHAFHLLRGDYSKPGISGELTHFQALATAVSGTVGIGNIGSVAIAITVGGPGATFWLMMAGFLGMSTKFAECVVGVKYRKINPDGSISGGLCIIWHRG